MEGLPTTSNFSAVNLDEDYSSSFETESEPDRSRKRKIRECISVSELPNQAAIRATRSVLQQSISRETGGIKSQFQALDAYSKHKKLINEYLLYHPGATQYLQRDKSKDKTDSDVLRENHQFLWDEYEDVDSWEKRLSKKYYDRLFKEYALADLCRYKENKIALRWRTEQEVIDGKGQFICANKKCKETTSMRSWEVNFGYVEQNVKKNALIKLRLCPQCSYKLNYRHQRKEAKKHKRKHITEEVPVEEPVSKKSKSELSHVEDSNENLNTEPIHEPQENLDSHKWKEPKAVEEEKTQEDEFEDYLAEMLL